MPSLQTLGMTKSTFGAFISEQAESRTSGWPERPAVLSAGCSQSLLKTAQVFTAQHTCSPSSQLLPSTSWVPPGPSKLPRFSYLPAVSNTRLSSAFTWHYLLKFIKLKFWWTFQRKSFFLKILFCLKGWNQSDPEETQKRIHFTCWSFPG